MIKKALGAKKRAETKLQKVGANLASRASAAKKSLKTVKRIDPLNLSRITNKGK